MADFSKISVVIVSWNVAESLRSCLKSLKDTHYPHLEIIVIDNNSQDDSAKVCKNIGQIKIRIIRNSENIGFPKAVNQGVRKSSGDFVLLLNPDARIPQDFFEDSLNFFNQHPTAAVMGPKLIDPDGTPQGSVFPEPSIAITIKEFWMGHKGLTGKFIPDENKPTIVNAVSGACMFIPRSTIQKVGLFTESVFMYFEDLDYCRRIRKSGMRVYFNPQIEVIHLHGASAAKNPLAKDWRGYSKAASIWYNGPIKHYLMWFISWSGQKIRGTH